MIRSRRGPDAVVVRPRVLRWVAWLIALAILALLSVGAVLMRISPTGVYLRVADQVALALLGVLLAGAALLFARPRVRADAHGAEVRNVLLTRRVPWSEVVAISFPDGASWARLELPDDEYLPMLAIQASDRERAVAAITALRQLHGEHARDQRDQPLP